MTPTYGNTLMGLAASAPTGPHNNYKISYYAPQPRAVIEVVDSMIPTRWSRTARRDACALTTLAKEFSCRGSWSETKGSTSLRYERFPWDGVSGVRPYRGIAATTTVGVY